LMLQEAARVIAAIMDRSVLVFTIAL